MENYNLVTLVLSFFIYLSYNVNIKNYNLSIIEFNIYDQIVT
jgi:hypothetical protein